jgi:hypothetical protein
MVGRYCRSFLLLPLLVTISGCQSLFGGEGNTHSVQGITVVHAKSSEQFSYVKEHEELARFCAETDTDSQGTSSSGLSLSAEGDSIGDKSSSGVVTLGGRDPTVLITRELMFRACELILNTNAEAPDAVKIYVDTLNALLEIVKVHTGTGTTSVSSDADTDDSSGASTND